MFYPKDQRVYSLPEVKEAWEKFRATSDAATEAHEAYVKVLEEASE